MLYGKCVVAAGLFLAMNANAGQIQIGGGINGADGLNTTWVTNTGGWSERAYVTNLFSNVTATLAGLPTKTNTTGSTSSPGSQSVTDANGIKFNMINDPVANGSDYNYAWASPTSGAVGSITIPVNVFGVQDIYVMLNDYSGYAGLNSTITFNFASGADTITLADLANGTGAIRSAVQCISVTGTGVTCPGTTPNGHTVSSSSPLTTNTNTSGDATIVTSAVWSGTYTSGGSGNTDYYKTSGGTTGNLILDELKFSFSSDYSSTTLNSITVTPPSLSGNALGTQNERLGLSAVTVTTTTPEPSSLMLIAGSLAFITIRRFRTKK